MRLGTAAAIVVASVVTAGMAAAQSDEEDKWPQARAYLG